MRILSGKFIPENLNSSSGLTVEIVKQAIEYSYEIIDQIDEKLTSVGANKISQMIELANYSSILGNLIALGIEKKSEGKYIRNLPHKYPDILAVSQTAKDIEIKISLELNKPKGHLAKSGFYMICRYVLLYNDRNFVFDQRGDTAEIWEIRFGYLETDDFNLSNTPGDSGKTAVINKNGMEKLKLIYVNLETTPFSKESVTYQRYLKLISNV